MCTRVIRSHCQSGARVGPDGHSVEIDLRLVDVDDSGRCVRDELLSSVHPSPSSLGTQRYLCFFQSFAWASYIPIVAPQRSVLAARHRAVGALRGRHPPRVCVRDGGFVRAAHRWPPRQRHDRRDCRRVSVGPPPTSRRRGAGVAQVSRALATTSSGALATGAPRVAACDAAKLPPSITVSDARRFPSACVVERSQPRGAMRIVGDTRMCVLLSEFKIGASSAALTDRRARECTVSGLEWRNVLILFSRALRGHRGPRARL